jgi:hypothetical protein
MYPHSYAISWLINYLTWIPVFPRTVASAITPPACSCGSLAILVKQTSKFNGMAQKEIQEHELLFEYILLDPRDHLGVDQAGLYTV